MSTTNGGQASGPAAGQASDAAQAPQLMVLAQYTKDLSFENPNAPRSLTQAEQPQIGVTVNVSATPMSDSDVEVELRLEGKAEGSLGVMFNVELVFAGMFRIQNVPQEQLHPVMMIECPRLLFPFAREIIASTVRQGGYPPLLLDPIDFVALYQQRVMQAEAPSSPLPSA